MKNTKDFRFEIMIRIGMALLILAMFMSIPVSAKETKQATNSDIEAAIDLTCEHVYPTVGKVVKVKRGIVYVSEMGGNIYSFYGSKRDYHKGDIIALMMYDNGTYNDETDDEIIKSINYGPAF